ncbi:helix-turn-helix domain-containing protein [Streptomyces drozdowiczii]
MRPARFSRASGDVTPTSGVIHVNSRHTSGFTVIGNHLAQHSGLSLLAIGLAVHIQSLPECAKVGVKALTARFPESEMRIAAALRELEAAGYLRRIRVRRRVGRVRTRTESHNRRVRNSSGSTGACRRLPARRAADGAARPLDAPEAAPGTEAPPRTAPPARLLRHRITALLQPPAPGPGDGAIPLQNCDDCNRAFRAPEPGQCRDCRGAQP